MPCELPGPQGAVCCLTAESVTRISEASMMVPWWIEARDGAFGSDDLNGA